LNSYDFFSAFPILRTARCILSQPEISQAGDLFEIYGDESTMKFMQMPRAESIDDCRGLIRSWREDFDNKKGIRWSIELKEKPGRLIGTIALHYWSPIHSRVELGADINRKYQGQGLAAEVTGPVIAFAFDKMMVNRCELRCNPDNEASIRIAGKFDLKLEGILKEYVYVEKTGFVDEAVFAILRKDYIKLRPYTLERATNASNSLKESL